MRKNLLLILVVIITQSAFGQKDAGWILFIDSISELSGYKDIRGEIKLAPKFWPPYPPDTFHNIIPVYEKVDSSFISYYLLKNGRKVGRDSVFMFDFTSDCESEGKIIYSDKKKDRVGFLDSNGVAIIPAIYNYAGPFRNGLALAHRNAKRRCWDERADTQNCEHLGWDGGETILINERNEILADHLTLNLRNINWYSLKLNDRSVDTAIYVNIPGRNGNVYSFMDFEREFSKWFNDEFLRTLNSKSNDKLKKLLFSEVTFWNKRNGWTAIKKDNFLRSYPTILNKERFKTSKLKTIQVMDEDLSQFILNKELYSRYYTSCGAHNRDVFPLFNVMLTWYKNGRKKLDPPAPSRSKPGQLGPSDFVKTYEIDYQEHFQFIRTEQGYRLLRISTKR